MAFPCFSFYFFINISLIIASFSAEDKQFYFCASIGAGLTTLWDALLGTKPEKVIPPLFAHQIVCTNWQCPRVQNDAFLCFFPFSHLKFQPIFGSWRWRASRDKLKITGKMGKCGKMAKIQWGQLTIVPDKWDRDQQLNNDAQRHKVNLDVKMREISHKTHFCAKLWSEGKTV